jgi:anti-repressor protein
MSNVPEIINHNGRRAVGARDLYNQLGFAPQHWGKWHKKNITGNEFAIGNEDYQELPLSGRSKDFAISIDFAKRLAMMARTEQGERIRNYFIECEQRVIEDQPRHTPEELLLHNAQILLTHSKRIKEIEDKIKEVEAKTITAPGDYYAIAGYASLIGMPIDVHTAAKIGSKAKALCRNLGFITGQIPDPRFGRVHTYPKDILKSAFDQFYNGK